MVTISKATNCNEITWKFSECFSLSKIKGDYGRNYSLGTVTPGLPTIIRKLLLNQAYFRYKTIINR